MTDLNTELYATQRNGGKAGVTIATIGSLVGGGTVPASSTTVAGIAKQAADQEASVATDVAGLVTDFNALLTKLKAAGLMA